MADEYSAKPVIEKTSPATQSKKPSPKHKFEGHEGTIWSFVFLHDNKHIVSGSSDGTMRKWDCHTGLLVGKPWKGKGGRIWVLALSPDGNTIACVRGDGSVQYWNTEGKMIKGVWRQSNTVRSVSWSPNGGHIASGSYDGTILIRKAENSKFEMDPIETGQDSLYSLVYSPSGDRIASGGYNDTICIWDSSTGDLLVGPIKDLGRLVTSVVWSSDSSKLYSASKKFVRVFDSVSGTELHHFEHNHYVFSIAFSPKRNLLACVGLKDVAQLWDTETYQPLGKPFSPWTEDKLSLQSVSFSRDGQYVAYCGSDRKITLWMVEDIAPQFALPASAIPASATQEKTLPEPTALSYLDVDATNPSARPDDMEDGQDDPYNGNFLQSSHSSLQSSFPGSPTTRRFWGAFVAPSVLRTSAKECVQLTKRLELRFPTRRPRPPATPPDAPANKEPTKPKPDGKVRAREERDKDIQRPDVDANSPSVPPVGDDIEDGHDDPHDNLQPLEFSHPFEALGSSRPSQLRKLLSPRSLWNVFIPSRHGPPADQSIPLQSRIKRDFFPQHAGPQPVIVAAARPRRFYWTVPRSLRRVASSTNQNVEEGNGNTHAGQPSSTTVQPPHAATSHSTPQGPQNLQSQAATRPLHQDEPDYGCWGNLWVCCIQHTRPPTVSISVSPIP